MTPAPDRGAPGLPRTFRRSIVGALLGATMVSAGLVLAALGFIPRLMPITTSRTFRAEVAVAVAVAVVAVLLVWAVVLWLRNLRVVVTAETVEVRRPLVRGRSYDRATSGFSSKVTEQRTNGIRSGTTRALVVQRGELVSTIELPGFTRRTFNELIATIRPVVPVDALEPSEAGPSLPTTFRIDAGRGRSSARTLTWVIAVLVVVSIGAGLLLLVPGFIDAIGVVIAPMALVVAIGLGIAAAIQWRVMRSVPGELAVSRSVIRVDDREFSYSELQRVWVTPPGYATRRMTLVDGSGRRHRYLLSAARIEFRPDYAVFLAALQRDTAHLPGLVSLDLE